MVFFLISSIVLGLLDKLLIFSQLYLIELLEHLTGLGLLELLHLIYPRLLTGFGMLVFTNSSQGLMEFQVRYLALFLLFSAIDGFELFWMESLHKNIDLMLEFPKSPFLVLLFLLYINDLSDDGICNIDIHVDDTTLYSKRDQASDRWQQLELASELEFDLRDTVDWGKKWLVDFSAGDSQLVLFDRMVPLM